jgi:hypothetical protein
MTADLNTAPPIPSEALKDMLCSIPWKLTRPAVKAAQERVSELVQEPLKLLRIVQ